MLMSLLWGFAEPFLSAVLGVIPEAPEAVELSMPWPAWVPSWPFTLSLVTTVVAGSLFLGLRLTRWLYGLIPVVQ